MKNKIKKTISVFTALLVLAAVMPVGASAAGAPLRLTVAADTHFRCRSDLGAFSDKYAGRLPDPELYGYASTQGQMDYESGAILDKMLSEFETSDSDTLLIAGDLTCGRRASHLELAERLRRTELSSGKRIFVINGNHDCAAGSGENVISMEEFREIYADFGYDEALDRHADSASYSVDLDDDHRLIAIDSCIYGEDEGQIGASVFRWIKSQTDRAKKDGKTPIAMMHHSILPHYRLQPMTDLWSFYAGWLADHGVKIVLTGHIHANDISSAVSDLGNTLYDIQTGSLICSPNTYRILTCDGDAVSVESRFIKSVDASLLPDMMTERQKALIAADLPSYARGYFDSGVCKWLERNVGSPDRLARWFGLEAGTAAYEAAEKLTGALGDAVSLDIYDGGEGDSIERELAPYGVEVPSSGYVKPYEVAATLMYGFFHGDETTVSSPEDTALLLTCLEGAALHALRGTDKASLGSLVVALTGKALSLSSLREAAEKTALALLETLADGIADDLSAPADLNVTLYFAQRDGAVALHALIRAIRLFVEFIKRLFVL